MQTNKILILSGIIILCMVFGAAWLLKSQKETIEKWEADYSLLQKKYEKSENEKAEIIEDREALVEALRNWKEKYESITKENSNAKEQIRELQKANSEICKFLASNIDDDLWNILFPKNGPYCITN